MGDREDGCSNITVWKSCRARHGRELAVVLPGTQECGGRLEGVGPSPDPGIARSPLLMGVANEEKDRATRFGSHITSSLSLEAM